MISLRKLALGLLVTAGLALSLLPTETLAQATGGNLTSPALGPYRNMLVCGDFGTCPWQGGTANAGGNIAATGTYTADQWFCFGGASSSINVNQSNTAAFLPAGQNQAFLMQRTAANANTAALNCAQMFEQQDVIRLQGQPITLSFWMTPGANFSGTAVVVNFITGTGNAANNTAANLVSGSWTGQATTCTQSIPFTNASSQTRFQPGTAGGPYTNLTCTVPSTATELAIEFQWVPVGTAGTTDAIALAGVQLEQGTTGTPFERRSLAQELALAQRYFVFYTDTGSTAQYPATGVATSTTAVLWTWLLPQTMRAAPTSTLSATTIFGATCGSTANSAESSFAVVSSSATPNTIGFTSTTTTTTAGFGCILTGKNTSATLALSARL